MFKKKITIQFTVFVALIIFICVIVLGWNYIKKNGIDDSLISGLFVGLLVVLIQFSFSWFEYDNLLKFERLGLRQVLKYREGKDEYQSFISDTKQTIDLMGLTASRFIQDFARDDKKENQALLSALQRGVKVRFLLVKHGYLETEVEKANAKNVHESLNSLAAKYDGLFEFRYYDHVPTHSLLFLDEMALIGPYFPGVKSDKTPCFRFKSGGEFLTEYYKYFEREWSVATTSP